EPLVTTWRGRRIRFKRSAPGSNSWIPIDPQPVAYQFQIGASSSKFYEPSERLIYTFDGSTGSLTRIDDENGNALTVTPGAAGPTQVADGLGRTLRFTYAGTKLVQVTDQSGRKVTFAYQGDNLSGFTDAAGNTTSYTYAAQGVGLIADETKGDGNKPFSQTWD